MSRPLRIEYPSAYYHVMNRGMAGQSVFLSDADYDLEAELNASSRWPAQVLYKKRLDPNSFVY